MNLDLATLSWKPVRHLACEYASQGSLAIHRFPGPVYVVSNGAWLQGDPQVRTVDVTCSQLPTLPPTFPPRFQWCSRPGRDGYLYREGGFVGHMNPQDPGEQGGGDILLHPPATPNIAKADAIADRMPVAAYHRNTGLPLTRRELGTGWEYRLDRGMYDTIQQVPHFRREPSSPLNCWVPHDEYHLTRGYMEDLAAWRKTRSTADPAAAIARLRILMAAEDMRMSYTETEIAATSAWRPRSLPRYTRDANGQGQEVYVRGLAWAIRLGVCAMEVGTYQPDVWRNWIAGMVTYTGKAQRTDGTWFRGGAYWAHMGEPWYIYDAPESETYDAAWQQMFLIRALWEAQKVVPEIKRKVHSQLTKVRTQWRTCPLAPGEYPNWPDGLPLYINTDGGTVTKGLGLSRSEYEPDAFQCFTEAGIA